jgi:hypothetical protein
MKFNLHALFDADGSGEKISLVLRGLALLAGIFQLIFGEKGIGLFIIISVAAITVPQVITKNRIKSLPIEFELIFIIMVWLQLIVGETLDFYNNVPYYDKFIHFSLPLFVGLISFILAYTLTQTGSLYISTVPLMIVIIFFTLGIGALWEIIEYTSDTFINPILPNLSQLQGSVVESAHDDTMKDLVLDFLGGIFGALLGLRYIRTKNKFMKPRAKEMIKEITKNYSRKRAKKIS